MGIIYTLDRTGHGELVRWDPAVKAEVKTAEEVFAQLAPNHALVDISDPEIAKPALKVFDPEATEIMAIPQLQGG